MPKNEAMKNIQLIAVSALILGGAAIAPAQAHPNHPRHHVHYASADKMESMMQMCDSMCKQMMSDEGSMMERMKAMDTKLSDLQKEIAEASGDAKIEALANAVNELIDQRLQMDQMMQKMHERMMGNMGGMGMSGKSRTHDHSAHHHQ